MEAVIFLSIIIALFSILVSCFAIRRVKKTDSRDNRRID